jgi:xanthine dehydrogenase YagR molybdenum-binding subunit
MNEIIGKPIDRVDGRLKVTGGARYAAEFQLPNMAHGYCVQSTIAKGRIRSIDTKMAEAAPGVLAVITYKNAAKLKKDEEGGSIQDGKLGEKNLLPLQDDIIHYDGQHIGVVVADTFEHARDAASLIKVDYTSDKPVVEIEQALPQAFLAEESFGRKLQVKRGDPDTAFQSAEVKVDQTYVTPVYHHNPMEPHATIADWKGDELTLYDATQWVQGTRNAVAKMLGVPSKNVRVVSLFVGGGFGCKGFLWAHPVVAAMASQRVGRPVKVVLSRQQMFTSNGHRGRTIQQIALGAKKDGKLTSVRHLTTTQTSFVDEFPEPCGLATRILYACPNLEIAHKLVRLNTGTPTPTRAPGEAPGTFAIESAMDELAYKLKMDPVELRLANYAEENPHNGKQWSSKHLNECYRRGADAIGWSQRKPEPASMREGDHLVGYGMATATYPGNRSPASAKVQIFPDGHAVAASCTQDIGTGTYTIMTQIAAEALGLPLEKVEFKLGDSSLPNAPVSGGSQTAVSVGSAVRAAALAAKSKIIALAIKDKESPLKDQNEDGIEVENGRLILKENPLRGETYSQILKRQRLPTIEAECTTNVSARESEKDEGKSVVKESAGGKGEENGGGCFAAMSDEEMERQPYAFHSFGAQFAKVIVDPLIGRVRVVKCASVMDIGRVLNLKMARNQIRGGFIFGLGMALMEQTVFDPVRGRIVTRDLANYHVPVNADVPEIEVQFIDEPDPHISPIGARGIGEIGITGAVAAISNAVYHATGKRIRELPITPDKLI